MPVYNIPLLNINIQELRRYAGLNKTNFPNELLEEACMTAKLTAEPQAFWQLYDYEPQSQHVIANPSLYLKGKDIGQHLSQAEKIIFFSITIGKPIEDKITACFQAGQYSLSLLVDAAATTAVEQTADALEKMLQPKMSAQGYYMNWRFSPGYGDWDIGQQTQILHLAGGNHIGIGLTEAGMLTPRKSITAVIGLSRTPCQKKTHDCQKCNKKDCPARKE